MFEAGDSFESVTREIVSVSHYPIIKIQKKLVYNYYATIPSVL